MAGTAKVDRFRSTAADSKIVVVHAAADGGRLILRRLFAILLGAADAKKSTQCEMKVQKSSLSLDLWTFALALAAPTSHFGKAEPIFRQMIQTIRSPTDGTHSDHTSP